MIDLKFARRKLAIANGTFTIFCIVTIAGNLIWNSMIDLKFARRKLAGTFTILLVKKHLFELPGKCYSTS